MDATEAAHLLGVAPYEVSDVRHHAGWWEARHHDMASHVDSWRPVVPAPADTPDTPTDTGETEPGTEPGEVPDGSAREVLEWVDGDPGRARAAIAAENRRERPRVTLLGALESIADA